MKSKSPFTFTLPGIPSDLRCVSPSDPPSPSPIAPPLIRANTTTNTRGRRFSFSAADVRNAVQNTQTIDSKNMPLNTRKPTHRRASSVNIFNTDNIHTPNVKYTTVRLSPLSNQASNHPIEPMQKVLTKLPPLLQSWNDREIDKSASYVDLVLQEKNDPNACDVIKYHDGYSSGISFASFKDALTLTLVLSLPEYKKYFTDFCSINAKCPELVEFLNAVDEYKANPDVIERIAQAQFISRMFLVDADKSINISSVHRNEAIHKIKALDINSETEHVFNETYSDVMEMLELDIFPRFISSEICNQMIMKSHDYYISVFVFSEESFCSVLKKWSDLWASIISKVNYVPLPCESSPLCQYSMDIHNLLDFHTAFLGELRKASALNLLDVIRKYANHFVELYASYISLIIPTLYTLINARENAEFKKILRNVLSSDRDFFLFFLTPIHHFLMYSVFLQYLPHSFNRPQDFKIELCYSIKQQLNAIFDKVDKVFLNIIINAVSISETQLIVKNLNIPLLVNGRLLLKFGTVFAKTYSLLGRFWSNENSQVVVYLFSDILFWTDIYNGFQNKISFTSASLESRTQVCTSKNDNRNDKYSLIITGKKHSLTLCFSHEGIYNEWKDAITEAMELFSSRMQKGLYYHGFLPSLLRLID